MGTTEDEHDFYLDAATTDSLSPRDRAAIERLKRNALRAGIRSCNEAIARYRYGREYAGQGADIYITPEYR